MREIQFGELVGLTLCSIEIGAEKEAVTFRSADGRVFTQYHSQDCCEGVSVEEVVGDLSDMLDTPILLAEEAVSENETPEGVDPPEDPESYTWTFYKLATIKGHVTIRWLGESNGYYSESVVFYETTPATAQGD